MHVRACVAVAVLSAAALAGCGGSTKTKTVTVTARPVTTRVAGTTPTGTTTATVTSPPLATRTGTIDKEPVTLSIVSLKRSGTTLELTLSLSTTSSQSVTVGDTFDDGVAETVTGGTTLSGAYTLDGIYLIDTTDSKKYPVARDSNNACLCDSNLLGPDLTSAAPMLLSATFGAPPTTVTAMDVFIPQFGTFVNVPLG
jgi:hypothetical protein